MSPRALLLDLGNVLVTFDHRDTCRALAEVSPLDTEEIYRRLFEGGLEAGFDRGAVDVPRFLDRVADAIEAPDLDRGVVRRAWCEIFRRQEEALALLAPLAERFRLVLVSNTNALHYERIEELVPELAHLHAQVLSHRVGATKPDPRFYRASLEAAGAPAAACLLVDDGPANVEGARRAGIPAALHPPGGSLAATLADAGLRL